MNLVRVFRTLTKAQHKVMDVLCTMHGAIPAVNLKPATLGALCTKKLVNVNEGMVSSTCVMLWNMTFHKEMFDVITKERVDKMEYLIWSGKRIGAIRILRECTGWGLRESVEWMNLNYPK